MIRYLLLFATLLAVPVSADGVTWVPKNRGLPTGVRVQAGPIQAEAHLITPRPEFDEECGCAEPLGFNALPIAIGYWYTPPGSNERRNDQTFGDGGYIQTDGARLIELFIMTDDRYNVARVTVHYGRRLIDKKPGRAVTTSTTFGDDGYRFAVGGLNGIRILKVTTEYESLDSKVVGKRTDCVTVDAQRIPRGVRR